MHFAYPEVHLGCKKSLHLVSVQRFPRWSVKFSVFGETTIGCDNITAFYVSIGTIIRKSSSEQPMFLSILDTDGEFSAAFWIFFWQGRQN